MSRPSRRLFPTSARRAVALGERLRAARLRRRLSETEMATRVDVSRMTIHRLERGDLAVSLAVLLRCLEVLSLDADIDAVAADDALGARLADLAVPGPRRRAAAPRSVGRGEADEL